MNNSLCHCEALLGPKTKTVSIFCVVFCCFHAPEATLTEAYGQVALVVEDVGKSKRPAAVPTEKASLYAGRSRSRDHDPHRPIPCFFVKEHRTPWRMFL